MTNIWHKPMLQNPNVHDLTQDVLQDLAQYSKFREKAAAAAARSLVALFRELAPGMSYIKDRA